MMGTEILKIDAEMAEKIEVEVGNPNLKTDRKSWLMMWFSKKIAPTVIYLKTDADKHSDKAKYLPR